MPSKFFQKINYSASNEDPAAELAALQITSTDTVLCISGSGARALDLLAAAPNRVICLDFNPAQNHLLRLKLAAFQHLEHAEFMGFMGTNERTLEKRLIAERQEILRRLLTSLPDDSQRFWERHSGLIRKGLLYCGTWEKILRSMSLASFIRRRQVDGLFNSPNLAAQIDFWNQHWSGTFLKAFLRVLSTRFLWTHIIREPGAHLIPRSFDIAGYLHRSLTQMAQHSLLYENPFANLLFFGRYTERCQVPWHLRAENFLAIREKMNCLEIVTDSLDDYLAHRPETIDAFSLSDFSSYAPRDLYQKIWNGIGTAARPQARFCERFFLVKRDSENWDLPTKSDSVLEQRLGAMDHTCMYSFRAGLCGTNFRGR